MSNRSMGDGGGYRTTSLGGGGRSSGGGGASTGGGGRGSGGGGGFSIGRRHVGKVPTAERATQIARTASMPTSSPVRGEGVEATRQAPPRPVGIFLFGPGGRLLRAEIDERIPWLDQSTGHLIHLELLGDPRNSGPGFWDVLRGIDLTMEVLVREWAALVEEYGSEEAAERFETHLAAERFQITLEDLPTLVFLDDATGQPLRLRLPRDHELKDGRAALVTKLIQQELSTQTISELFSAVDASDRRSVTEALRTHLARLQASIDRQRFVPESGLDPTDERILGLLRQGGKRLVTREIASQLDLSESSIGKNLSKLSQLGYLDNVRRGANRGYGLTPLGRSAPLAPRDSS